MHPAVQHVLKFFGYSHLPAHLQDVSRPFSELAQQVAERAPDSQETTVALRKLLEAKDAAIRAILPLVLLAASQLLWQRLPDESRIVVADRRTKMTLDGERVREPPAGAYVTGYRCREDCVTLRSISFRSR